jgi:hypothetical protein
MGELVPSGTTIDDINKAKEEATKTPKPEPVEYVGPMFKTVIKNNRDTDAVLQDDRGGNWLRLPAGKQITLDSWSPKTMYAPFSKVVFEKNGKVTATRRFNFKDPAESAPYSILLDNRDGGEQEVVQVDGEYVSAIKGLPRRVAISLIDPRVAYRAIVWKKKTIKEPHPANRSYLLTRQIVERVLVPRKAAELRAIRKELEKRALREARQAADRAFKRIAPVEVEEDAETPSAE